MRSLLALVSVIGIAAGIWILQQNAEQHETGEQLRTPVIRVVDVPLPVEEVANDTAPALRPDSFEAASQITTADQDTVRFIPADAASTSVNPRVTAHRTNALGRSFDPAPPTGYVDQVVALDDDTDRDALEAAIEDLDGEVLRYFSNLDIASVRVPEENVDMLAELQGVRTAAPDTEITFMSKASREAARLPTAGMPEFSSVDTSIGVAVVDTGVDSHADINLAGTCKPVGTRNRA